MTNTKFRKRALLSAVAMLLVAMLALGSATFAWFSTRTTADATGLAGATVKSSSLVIKETWAGTWANSITFAGGGGSGSLDPVTFNGTAWKKTTAAAINTGYAADSSLDTVTIDASHHTTLFACYGVDVSGSSATKTLKVKVTPASGATAADLAYARVAIIPNNAIDETNAGTAIASGNTLIFGAAADDRATTGVWTGASDAANSPAVVWGASSTAQTLGTITEGVVYTFDVCVYFEGTDPDCKDNNAGISVSNFKFDFSLA